MIETSIISPEYGKAELKAKFVEMRAKGMSYIKIANELAVSKGTLTNWNREMEAEIASAKAMELEALQEEYCLMKESRIRLLGDQVKAIKTELQKRDFSDVPTDKLLDLLLKYQASMKDEYVKVNPLAEQQTRIDTKLNGKQIAAELDNLFIRYRAGNVDISLVKSELALLVAMLKAHDQSILEEKLERLESILETRR